MNQKYDQTSQISIFQYGKNLLGKSLRNADCIEAIPEEFLNQKTGKKTKGSFGNILERNYFGINPGGDSAPDFKEAGLELKSHPIKKISKGFSSKERLVLGMIDYHEIINEDFNSSKFYFKNKDILLVSYLHELNKVYVDFEIKLVEFLKYENFPKEDKKIILEDWKKIQKKIEEGKAHELSEGDTMYLGACTKSATSKNRKSQPNNNEPAKPRAFSYKNGFMTYKIQSFLKQQEENELHFEKVKNKTFDEFIYDKLVVHIGKSISELKETFGEDLNFSAKGFNRLLIQRILGSKKKRIPEFEKADVTLKVIRLNQDNLPKEDISFPAFKFEEIIKENIWEESELYYYLTQRFLFVFFKENNNGEFILDSYKFWTMPSTDLNEAERIWNETKRVILSGKIVSEIRVYKNGEKRVLNNFPNSKESYAVHVRPHARNREDTYVLPVEDFITTYKEFTKQCFWLNKGYVKDYIYEFRN